MNKNKSYIIIFNSKNQPEYIEYIPIATSITVNIHNKKDCYKLQRTEATKIAKMNSSMMPAIIAKSCNIILMGKTYWRSAALPARLHRTSSSSCRVATPIRSIV